MITEKIENMINEINNSSREIPFGNSKHQNIKSVIAGEITPARAYRHCLLRMNSLINALRENYYIFKLENVDIEEMQDKLKNENIDRFEKKRLEIKIEQMKSKTPYSEKLIEDCLVELHTLYEFYKNSKKYTREDFEEEEQKHFELKFAREMLLKTNYGQLDQHMEGFLNRGSDMEQINEMLKNPTLLNEEIEKLNLQNIIGRSLQNVDKIQ